MTEREAFKFGFLARCADEGLSAEQVRERIKLANLGTTLAGLGATLGTATAIGAPVVGGAGIGYLAAKATEPQMDAEDAKMQELIAAYRQQAEQARRTAARIGYRTKLMRPRGRVSSPVAA